MNKIFWILLASMAFTAQVMAYGSKPSTGAGLSDKQLDQQQMQQLISEAITQFEQTAREDWSYRLSRYENEEGDITSSIEVFDPTKDQMQRWSLLSINGQVPTEKQTQQFVEDKIKKAKGDNEQNFSLKLSNIIQVESLQLISEDQDQLKASFDVYLSQFGEKATEKLQGTLIFAKDKQFIETVEITNTGVFSPLFSAKITDFKLTFRFLKIGTAILPEQLQLFMQGTFAFFTEIDEVSNDTFSEYRYVGR